jgi:2-oxoglutarate dehydrogenase E2 component (dihydrolipoamide succinyltransferase)
VQNIDDFEGSLKNLTPQVQKIQNPKTMFVPQQKNKELRLSPSVRKFCISQDIDPSVINGSGRNGRVTREDILAYIESGGGIPSADTMSIKGKIVKLTSMRKNIAHHMVKSVTDAPHVTAVFEVNFSAIMGHRKIHKPKFAEQGVNLTYTSYIVAATAEALKYVPEVNSSFKGDYVEIYEDINIGVGTALEDKGLIVPVVRCVQDLDLLGVATALQDLTERARMGKLTQADIKEGTFSISNHGVSGSLLATPIIINQPQAAILGVGKLEKRVVVIEENGIDKFVAKPMAYITLTIDHRILDGFQTNMFLTKFVETLESWS